MMRRLAAAALALKAMPAMPAYAHALAGRPLTYAGAYRVNPARHLMTRDAWVADSRP